MISSEFSAAYIASFKRGVEPSQLGLCKTGFAEDTFFLLNLLRKTQIWILRGSSKLSEKLLCTKKSGRSGEIQVLFYSSELNELLSTLFARTTTVALTSSFVNCFNPVKNVIVLQYSW